jgi:hypothetical protein
VAVAGAAGVLTVGGVGSVGALTMSETLLVQAKINMQNPKRYANLIILVLIKINVVRLMQ